MGILRVGCSADVARDLMGPNLGEFLERYPDIDIRLRVGERLLPSPGSLDVVLHAGWLADSRLIVRRITDIPTLLIASRRYVEAKGNPTSVEDLVEHAVIGNFYLDPASTEEGRLPARVPILELCKGRDRVPVPIWKRFSSTDHHVMLQLVHRGVAIAPIAALHAHDGLLSGELVQILPNYELFDQPTLNAVYTERIAVTPKLKVFLEFVSEIVARTASTARPALEMHLARQRRIAS